MTKKINPVKSLSLLERRKVERVIWEHAVRTAAQILDTEYAPERAWLKGDGHPHSEPGRLVWDRLYHCTPPQSEWMQEEDDLPSSSEPV